MISRVKRILGRPRLSTATSIETYFGAVNKPGEYSGPHFRGRRRRTSARFTAGSPRFATRRENGVKSAGFARAGPAL